MGITIPVENAAVLKIIVIVISQNEKKRGGSVVINLFKVSKIKLEYRPF